MINPVAILAWVLSALAFLVAITVHEFAHAWTADRLGDPNPRLQGRLSLNPFRHLDLIGTLMLLIFRFGWGKPVQFDPYNLKNPRRDSALIAVAGAISNLLTALLCSGLLFLVVGPYQNSGSLVLSLIVAFLTTLLQVSLMLAFFNLIPIPPLDGSHILTAFLPPKIAAAYNLSLRKIGVFLLVLLVIPIFTDRAPVSYLLSPIINNLYLLLTPG